jgi:hypothetical protein
MSKPAPRTHRAVIHNDDEALTFGKRVIQEMMHRDAGLYASWTIDLFPLSASL